MSMDLLTIFQFFQILLAYLCMTFLLPALILYPFIKKLRFAVRFMVYQLVGNFYMMNVVFLLQLLHISYRFTLVIFTAVPFCVVFYLLHKKSIQQIGKTAFYTVEKLAEGELGVRLFLRQIRIAAWKGIKKGIFWIFRKIRANFFDIVLFIGVTAALVYVYGVNLVQSYGYCASDIIVHNYWINAMGDNDIFVAGVYPFGFHCVIYYLHEVFDIATYVLLRIFWFVQTLVIHYMLLAFLKCCTKAKYTAYIGLFIYTLAAIFLSTTYTRYFSSLPQEFGMIFILPAIYFLFAFLEKQKREKKKPKVKQKAEDVVDLNVEEKPEGVIDLNVEEEPERVENLNIEGASENEEALEDAEKLKAEEKKEKNLYLACFIMSFSMTLSAHFYDTMICGLFCIGVAVGYCFRLLRKEAFKKVMLAGIIAIAVAVLPMGIAYATGTPLQGSLGWGMSVITGGSDDDEDSTEDFTSETDEAETEESSSEVDEAETEESSSEVDAAETEELSREANITETVESSGETSTVQEDTLLDKLIRVAQKLPEAMWVAVSENLILEDYPILCLAVFASIALLIIFSLLFFILRQPDYAARLLSTAVYMVLMSVLFASGDVGLPQLMDQERTSIFYAYSIVIVWSLDIDAVLHLFLGWKKTRWLMNLASFALVVVLLVGLEEENMLRDMGYCGALETNDAVTCMTNIINENEDGTWTIVSANDEMRMAEDYGYHYELDTFLREMEYFGEDGYVVITTQKVYFFIEKVPINYTVSYEGSGQSVSEEGASNPLPANNGINMYKGENRWIEMSRMYYWAQAYQNLIPNEMTVYYESDTFICYVVEQDLYSPYNFAIDYGYNMGEY